MAASTAKRVFLYRFDRPPMEAIANPGMCFSEAGAEVISRAGNLISVPYADLKALCFVSESAEPDLFDVNNFFERRPKLKGLWVRFTLRDDAQIDGILPHNLLEWPVPGFHAIPPQAGSVRPRFFLPKLAVKQTDLLGVVGAVTRGRKKEPPAERQISMF